MGLRNAPVDDAEAIAKVHVASFRQAFRGIFPDSKVDGFTVALRKPKIVELLSDDQTRNIVFEGSEGIIGFVDFGKSRDENTKKICGEIYAIYVDPSSWGKQVAQHLLDEALNQLREYGYLEMTLWSVKDNLRARNFYLKSGFTVDRVKTHADNHGRERSMERFKKVIANKHISEQGAAENVG